jgi:SAM-dependent methyltransferase
MAAMYSRRSVEDTTSDVMNPRFTELLCCPKTGAELKLEVDSRFADGSIERGRLISAQGQYQYPIVNGIPRFVDQEHYAGSFGYEWQKWSRVQFEQENIGRPMAGHTTRMFESITELTPADLGGKLVVEFGCGPGRFLDIVRRAGGTAVGIDMSDAVESARRNFAGDPNVLIVQGDILQPPLKPNSFDIGYTFGVLHHTPTPARGLQALVGVVKPGGLIACSVYPRESFYAYPAVALYRGAINAIRTRLGSRVALALARWYAYFAAYVLHYPLALARRIPIVRRFGYYFTKYLCVYLPLPDPRWRVLDVFDAITPTFASTHTSDEVRAWFEQAGCAEIRQTRWGATSFVGRKHA